MAPRRGPSSANMLTPQDPFLLSTSAPTSPASVAFPQARSPSPSGLSQFFTKSSKWFTRKESGARSASGNAEPRSSTSSGRKPKISQPTDPRPLLTTMQSDPHVGLSSKSVLDLSQIRPSMDTLGSPSSPSSLASGGLGDLRSISRKGWSRSADDLGKCYSPVDTSFNAKVAEYRERSNSNASIGLPPASANININQSRQPFPTIITSSPLSSSPPIDTSLTPPVSGVSISVSSPSPSTEGHPIRPGQPLVHTRSHSFTPRLPSKLSTPKTSLIPPSPKRKGSGSSDQDSEGVTSSPSSVRGNFSFAFGGSHKASLTSNNSSTGASAARSTTLLSPPTIVEPEQDDDVEHEPNAKRTSQLLYHAAFINRLSENPGPILPSGRHAQTLSLSKGWKPFKLELKGSKLYFYKPPSDKAAAVRELFPAELAPAQEEEAEGEIDAEAFEGVTRTRRGSDREDGTAVRRKRAFWGRRTHPDLVQKEGGLGVERGNFEALVHEAVFATTFLGSKEDQAPIDSDVGTAGWKDFASAVLLCLPSLVGAVKFENEFLRCCAYLVSGADESVKENERARVAWLAGEFLRYHGVPASVTEWNEWKAETLPGQLLNLPLEQGRSGMPSSTSTQALYTPSPDPNNLTFSPNVNTFSPRPADSANMKSLLDALGSPEPTSLVASSSGTLKNRQPSQSLGSTLSSSRQNALWLALEREGLSRDVLHMLDPHLLVRSLGVFHKDILQRTPENLTAEFVLSSETSGSVDSSADSSSFTLLFGGEEQPHWLTKLILMQILGADTSTGTLASSHFMAPGRASEDRTVQTSRTHSRSEVISIWAKVGELCRLAGDECSWRAIFAALCSRPIARLDKAWKRVDSNALNVIESWVNLGPNGESATAKEPRITPWGGDAMRQIRAALDNASGDEGDDWWKVEPLLQSRDLFEGLRTSFSLCSRQNSDGPVAEDVDRMVTFWRESSNEAGNGTASKFTHVDHFMSLSFAAEPRRKGLFEPFYWTRSASLNQASCHPLSPLLFMEPLPATTLMDRSQIWRGRLESGPGHVPELLTLNSMDISRQPKGQNRRSFDAKTPLGFGSMDYSGTVIQVDGELILVVQTSESSASSRPASRAPSRPPSSVVDTSIAEKSLSRGPSIRVKAGSSHNLERKTSVARRNSLPSISQRPNFIISEPSSERPLRVTVQAGTLDRLVDILVYGLQGVSVSVADDNGEMSLREGKTRDLVVDHDEFSQIWWQVFRSFVTPFVLFELLRKRYITAYPTCDSPSSGDLLQTAQRCSKILEIIKEWIQLGDGAQDALDDSQLFQAIRVFLEKDVDRQHILSEHLSVSEAWKNLEQMKKDIRASFISQTMRPSTRDPILRPSGSKLRHFGKEAPDVDRIDAEELVDNLEAMAAAAFSNVNEEDLFITSDLLEVQTADRMGWFLPRDASTTSEDVEIQTLYSHIMEAEPSNMIAELGHDAIYRLLPPGIRSCIRAYGILRKWLVSKLVVFRLGVRTRQNRMDLFLRAIEITRLRNSGQESSGAGTAERPCVRSFVEAILTSAVVSAESRIHQRAWQNVGSMRGVQCDTLSSLLSRPFVQNIASNDPLTVDMGWLLERMLEIISVPDIVTPSSEQAQSLINFDKRKHLCNLILNAPTLASPTRSRHRQEVDRRDFERLNNIEKEVNAIQLDLRGIREDAHRESLQAAVGGATPAKKVSRPFQRLVLSQQEKNKRDKYLRDRLSKERKYEQQRIDKREDYINKAMGVRPRGMTKQQKQHRNKKSVSSAFFQFMRPISSAFTSDTLHTSGVKKTAAELDFVPSSKPALVLSVVEAKVAQYVNSERSFTFQLDTEDGGHYLLQAISKREMTKWLEEINRISKIAAKRRLTYLGNSPKPQLSDHIHSHPVAASHDPTAVFGVNLQELLDREAGGEAHPGAIPFVIQRCLLEVESRGLSEVGIYRIAGATSEINALKDAFNRGEAPITQSTDIHAVCDLVKSWFRVLPEPLFPTSSYHEVIKAMQLENLDARLDNIRHIAKGLPQPNFDLLRRVAEHLDKVTDYEEHNHMTAEALAIVFSPNLLRAPQNDFAMILANMGHTHKLVKALITHFHVIFDDDVDPEGEGDLEDDFDEPILEEEEEDEDVLPSPDSEDQIAYAR